MEIFQRTLLIVCILHLYAYTSQGVKINSPRVLLPWFENLYVNFTFEIIEGGCYSWSLSRDDIIDLEPLYEETWGHCSRAARVSVSKTCVPPGSVIILAEDLTTGEALRGDVDIDKISSLKVMSTTWKLYLEEAPEAFEVVAYDDQGNKFSTLEGVSFTWNIENLGNNVEEPLVKLVRWRDTDYEAPRGVTDLEARGLHSYSALLFGQAMGESRVVVCLDDICTDFDLHVVASVVLTPAVALIAPGDTLRYRVVRANAGRLTVQNIADTLYYMKVADNEIALLEDTVSMVRGSEIGTTSILLMSGATEVATATLTVAEPHSIRVKLRPANLVVRNEVFTVHSTVLDKHGHVLTAGDEILIRLSVEGEANVDLLRSTENGTITDAEAQNLGPFRITAKLYSIGGKTLTTKVEGQVSAVAVDPLEVVPPELFVAWTDSIQDIHLKHRGGGDESVTWSVNETATQGTLSLTTDGMVTVRGEGEMGVRVQLNKYPHIRAVGKVWSSSPELVQVWSSGAARVGRAHVLHLALTATHARTGQLYNYHVCDCASFTISRLEGPELYNVTAAPWIQPVEGACCAVQCAWRARGAATLRVARGRAAAVARILVRAAPALLWPPPPGVAALAGATLPVLAEGEILHPQSSEPRVTELTTRDGPPPHKYLDVQLFTLKCHRKGDSRLEFISELDDEERETVEFDVACAPHVSKIRLEPSETPGNCSGGPRVWLRPGQEVMVKVTLYDAIGRELFDEHGPKVSWEVEPKHGGIEYRATDRLFVQTHPDYTPVPVPYKYYQLVVADEHAVGWSGVLKASIPDAVASVQARVAAPLLCDPLKVNIAWEGETVSNITKVSGGSGRYGVETPKGVTASVENGVLNAVVPGPGSYDLYVTDLCVPFEKQLVQVHIEEVLSVEVSTARAVCVGGCVGISALVRGVSQRYLTTSGEPQWRVSGHVALRAGALCGLSEGAGRVRAGFGGVWSTEHEVFVFPPLRVLPERARVPPGARLQLRHAGGPPPHLASTHYTVATGQAHLEVSPSGTVHGMSTGAARVRLVARDIANNEMASAESEIEVVPISGLTVRAGTQTLLVGSPCPLWVEAGGLAAAALGALQPPPRVTWSLRDHTAARLYGTHADDLLERSVVEGLSIRVVPLKPGVIIIDVRVRNMGQVSETRSWDSTIEILGISDIRTSVEGLPRDLSPGDRLALAVGSTVRLKSLPRSVWKSYEDGAFELTPSGEIKALKPGHGVIIAQHKDERNNIYRETTIHVEVSVPQYCTVEPSGEPDEPSVRMVMRNAVGRELIAPDANVSLVSPLVAHVRRATNSALGNELQIVGLEATGTFMSFQGSVSGVTVRDDVWVMSSDTQSDRIVAGGGWVVCLEGVGWKAPSGVTLALGSEAGATTTMALLSQLAPASDSATHVLRRERPPATATIQQLPIGKIEFFSGDWPSAMVPLSIEVPGLFSGPVLCSEEQRLTLEGVHIELPFTCRTKAPHTAEPVLDIVNGQIGCSIIPSGSITTASEVELCAEWGVIRTCTRVLLLPLIRVSHEKVSLLKPPTVFTIQGHPHALKLVKMTTSPGLKLDTNVRDGEISVTVRSETTACGIGWVNIRSRLTSQELRVEVERECDVACGTLLGAIFSLIKPYLPTLMTITAIAMAYIYVQARLNQKSKIRMPTEPPQTVLPPPDTSTPLNRSRTWSRSPYASNGPVVPVYGDASMLPDNSYSPNSTRLHSFI